MANGIGQITGQERFLLIKPWSAGFWSDVHDIHAKLLLAELTNRHPVVFWGYRGSHYTVGEEYNSFEQYFLPVSAYSIGDVVSDKYTYYPPTWKFFNIFVDDPTKGFSNGKFQYRDATSFVNCNANVLVSDSYHHICEFMPWIKEDHPVYGLTEDEIHRYIHHKYLKLQPDIAEEIEQFYRAHQMEHGPVLALHIRGGNKIAEVPHLLELNAQYSREIEAYLKDNPSARIFLLTDDEAILNQYKQMYGTRLIYTDCTRKAADELELCLKVFPERRRKGIEIIKDSYLACKCDHFIGNEHSAVSLAIRRLKAWEKDKIKLFV